MLCLQSHTLGFHFGFHACDFGIYLRLYKVAVIIILRRTVLRCIDLLHTAFHFVFKALKFCFRLDAFDLVFSLRFGKLGFHLRLYKRAVVGVRYGRMRRAGFQFRFYSCKLGVRLCAFHLVLRLHFHTLGFHLGAHKFRLRIGVARRRLRGTGFHLRPYSCKLGVSPCAFHLVLRLHFHTLGFHLGAHKLRLRVHSRAVIVTDFYVLLTALFKHCVSCRKLCVEPCDFGFGFRPLLIVLCVFRRNFRPVARFENLLAFSFRPSVALCFPGVFFGLVITLARAGAVALSRAFSVTVVPVAVASAVFTRFLAHFRKFRFGIFRLLFCKLGFHLRLYKGAVVRRLHIGHLIHRHRIG